MYGYVCQERNFCDLKSLFSVGGFGPAVGAGAIEINEDVAGFGAFARADDAAVFQFIHDAGGAGVAEAQAALHEGDAGLLFAADDFDALLDEVLVLVAAGFVAEVDRGLGKLLVDFQFVAGLALPGDEIHEVAGFPGR